MTINQIKEIVNNIEYKKWGFYIGGDDDHPYLQVRFWEYDYARKDDRGIAIPMLQKCRKWQLSSHMIPTEIIRTAWKAVLAAEEHEAAEQFLYKHVALFNPHLDLDALVDHIRVTPLVSRPSPEKI